MAENARHTGKELGQGDQKFREEVYEQLWAIPDWDRVQQSQDTLTPQTFEFETGKSTRVQAKWSVGLDISRPSAFTFYWKLLAEKGFPEGRVQVTATIFSVSGGDTESPSVRVWSDLQQTTMTLAKVLDMPRSLGFNKTGLKKYTNSIGELVFNLKLTIMEPDLAFFSVDSQVEQFHRTSLKQQSLNFGALLGDETTADLKIMTSDGKELLAHKAILKAQCTVFESMFRSDLSENKSGVVNVEDIGSKTMGILLHYFYTGELLRSWKDEDTVLEFTYAVGKYQMTNVLNLLDWVLGRRDEEDATHTDIKLLDMARKLGLKTAENDLVERIKRKTAKVNSGDELFALYGIGQ